MLNLLLAILAFCMQATAPEVVTESWENGKLKSSCEVTHAADGAVVKHGKASTYYDNGQLESEGSYADGKRVGAWMFRWKNGRKMEYGSFAQDVREGPWKHHDQKGWLDEDGAYTNGFRTGPWKFYLDEKKKLDVARSGEYGHHREPIASSGATWEGDSFEGRKEGIWIARRAGGATMFVGNYEAGEPRGPWAFFHVDGSFDADFLSGSFGDDQTRRAIDHLPQISRPYAPTTPTLPPTDAAAQQELRTWLGATDPAQAKSTAQFLADPRSTLASVTRMLVELDLTDATRAATAVRLLDELVKPILGARVPWLPETSPEAVKTNHTTRLRLYALSEVAGMYDWPWRDDLDPTLHWLDVELSQTLFATPPTLLGFFAPKPKDSGYDDRTIALGGGTGGKYGGRRKRPSGGSGTELALEHALTWLASRQASDGSWNPQSDGGDPRARVAVTAQCLLAMIGESNTALQGRFIPQVRSGLERLVRDQDPETGLYDRAQGFELVAHALALQAVSEAAFFDKLSSLQLSAARGIKALSTARLADGSWPHCATDSTGDPQTTAIALMALANANEAGIPIDVSHCTSGLTWLLARLDPSTGLAHLPDPDHARLIATPDAVTVTAMTLMAKSFLGPDRKANPLDADGLLKKLASDAGDFGGDAWNWGALATYQLGGEPWDKWNKAMKSRLLPSQETEELFAGSWTPVPQDPAAGGRLYATATRAMTLETYFRYARMLKR